MKVAALEENRRGPGEGTTYSVAEERLRSMTEVAVDKLGTPSNPGESSGLRSDVGLP